MDPISKLALVFASVGALAGTLSGIISSPGIALLLAILFYYGAYKLNLTVLGIEKPKAPEAQAPQTPKPPEPKPAPSGLTKRKVLTSGFSPFFSTWLVFWIMVYTILLV